MKAEQDEMRSTLASNATLLTETSRSFEANATTIQRNIAALEARLAKLPGAQ